MPSSASHPLRSATAIAVAVVVGVAVVLGGGVATGAVPSEVLPPPGGDDGPTAPEVDGDSGVPDVDEDGIALRPAVLRSEAGRAVVDVVLGTDAPGDVVVELGLAVPEVSQQGEVTAGAPATTGRISRGGRLAPGETLRAELGGVSEPLVVVATVRPAAVPGAPTTVEDAVGADAGAAAPMDLAAVVLPGPVGPAPTAHVEVVGDELRATITAGAPLLVTARLRGARSVTHPVRLVLPDQPVVLTGAPARWPVPSELAVTDEAGRSTVVATDRTALAAVAGVLVLAAAAGAVLLRRRGRDRSTSQPEV